MAWATTLIKSHMKDGLDHVQIIGTFNLQKKKNINNKNNALFLCLHPVSETILLKCRKLQKYSLKGQSLSLMYFLINRKRDN